MQNKFIEHNEAKNCFHYSYNSFGLLVYNVLELHVMSR